MWAWAGSSAVVPREWESGPGETGRKFGFPQRALSTCFLKAGEASALSRFTRGRKGRVIFFLPFPFAASPSALAELVSSVPAPFPRASHSVCLSVAVSPGLGGVPAPPLAFLVILLRSYPPGIRSPRPGHRISAWRVPARHILQPVPGQPGQSGLIFNPCFHLTQQMLPKALGRRVLGSPPSCGVPRWGQDEEGRGLVCHGHS